MTIACGTSYRLKELFLDLFERSHRTKMEIFICLDSSTSVGPWNFKLGLEAAISFAKKVSSTARVGFLTFSDKAKVVSPLTDDKQKLVRAILRACFRRGGTNTVAALEATESAFHMCSGEEKCIVLITDGCPASQRATVAKADELRALGIKIIGIVIGNINLTRIEEICDPGWVYTTSNMASLLKEIGEMKAQSMIPEIELSFELCQLPIAVYEPFNMRVTLKNLNPNKIYRAGHLKLFLEKTKIYDECCWTVDHDIVPNDEACMSLVLHPAAGASVKKVPPFIKISARYDDADLYSKVAGVELEAHYFMKPLLNHAFPHLALKGARLPRILVLGPVGAGKSTLINGLLSMFFNTTKEYARTLSTTNHVTKKTALCREAQLNFELLDSMGISHELYEGDTLEHILSGACPVGFDISDESAVSHVRRLKPDPQQQIHGVIFTVPQAVAHDSNVYKYWRLIHIVRERQLPVVLVVTHGDEVATNRRRKAVRWALSDKLGVPIAQTFLIDQSSAEEKRIQAEFQLFAILRSVFYLISGAKKEPSSSAETGFDDEDEDDVAKQAAASALPL